MKKLIAILMALAVCGTVAYTAYAAEDAVDTETTTTTTEAAALDAIRKLADDEKAVQKANQIKEALAKGATKEDIKGLVDSLGKYVNGKGFTAEDVKKDAGAVNEVLTQFLEDCGVNTEVLNKAISESSIANAVLDLYYKPEETTTVPDETTTTTTDYSNPDCGAQF